MTGLVNPVNLKFAELKQTDFIKSTLPLIHDAIRKNNSLQSAYTLKVIQGPTFIRVDLIRKVHSISCKTILIISCTKKGKFINDSRYNNILEEERSNDYTFAIEDRFSISIPVRNTEKLNECIEQIVLPFIEAYAQ
jgi:hypothetical protein